jgi:hypothetical protein
LRCAACRVLLSCVDCPNLPELIEAEEDEAGSLEVVLEAEGA